MSNEDMQNLEDKLLDVDIGPLPPDEPLWSVPKPIQLSIPSPVSTPIPVFTNGKCFFFLMLRNMGRV